MEIENNTQKEFRDMAYVEMVELGNGMVCLCVRVRPEYSNNKLPNRFQYNEYTFCRTPEDLELISYLPERVVWGVQGSRWYPECDIVIDYLPNK